ncbi:MAG TPA: EFR1 family ferrodoxin [Clostridia bacterium]|nr:EFR1 family ferrodoxin [Clostridia bacterium]
MSTEIYYFSGTGNSLHIAKELQKRLPETELIPMASLINKDGLETNAETVGFVFPIHFATIPMLVKDIIKKLDLNTTKYIFAVATRAGTPCSTSFTKIDKILKKKDKNLDSYLILNMANNDSKFDNWHQITDAELAELEADVQTRLDSFQKRIIEKEKYQEKDTRITVPVNPVWVHLGSSMADARGYSGEDFYADTKCSGCGVCEKVCLSQKIRMVDEKPEWQKKSPCFLCYACINYCPVQSIQIKSKKYMKIYTEKNGRYHHPEATVNDISGQK